MFVLYPTISKSIDKQLSKYLRQAKFGVNLVHHSTHRCFLFKVPSYHQTLNSACVLKRSHYRFQFWHRMDKKVALWFKNMHQVQV